MCQHHRKTRLAGGATVAGLALLGVAVTGCGVGAAGKSEKVSQAATRYLRALAAGDTAEACSLLTAHARGAACEPALRQRLSRLDTHALTRAADDSMTIDVDGDSATAGLSTPKGARFVLARIGEQWRIASGYTLRSTTPGIPATPVGEQVRWALGELNGGAARLTEADVATHFARAFLTTIMPAPGLIATLRQTGAQRGPFTFTGFAFPPSATQAVALVRSRSGEHGSLRIRLDGRTPERIVGFEMDDAPATFDTAGRYNGRFDVGGRKLFLHCSGSGSPAVVFQGGLTSDWVGVQNSVARFTRACSYDPANGVWGRSDPAPVPRTAADYVADLHALLAAAEVPGPYVLVGHSNGGLFVQLYASEHPRQVAGLVLLDAVTVPYYARQIALYRKLLPPAAATAVVRALRAPVSPLVDPEQVDMETSLAQTRMALARHPLGRMPLFVLAHGHPDATGTNRRLAVATERLWQRLQTEVAALVPHSRHLVARNSGHDIHHEQPKLVIRAIHEVVRGVREPTTWATG